MSDSQELTERLRRSALCAQQTILRYERLLASRQLQLETAALIVKPATRADTLRDAMAGFAADLSRYTRDLEPDVEAFKLAAEDFHANSRAYVDWCSKHRAAHPAERRQQAERIRVVYSTIDMLERAEQAVAIGASASPELQQALAVHLALLREYRKSLDAVRQLAGAMLPHLIPDVPP